MLIKNIRRSACALAVGLALCAASPAWAYPDKPVSLIVPWTAGGSADVLARMIAKEMGDQLKQPFVVENRPGAAGTVGSCSVVRSNPDGYTLIFNTNSTYAIAPNLYKPLPCDIQGGLIPIGLLATNQQILAVNPKVGVKDLKAFIDLLKKNPGSIAFGSSGVGGTSHLAMELFMSASNTSMLHVPYKGGSDALQALLGNQVQAAFVDANSAVPVVNAGRVLALGASGEADIAGLDNVKPIRDQGLPDFDSLTAFALFAPKGTPPQTVKVLNDALNKAVKSAEFSGLLKKNAYKPEGGSAEELGSMVQRDTKRWHDLIRDRGIKVE